MVKERERREHAERVTKGLVALQPFVLPTPKPVALEPVGMSSLQWRRPCGDAFVTLPRKRPGPKLGVLWSSIRASPHFPA
jgi:hypothetical protein